MVSAVLQKIAVQVTAAIGPSIREETVIEREEDGVGEHMLQILHLD